jgi:hypothetical protein
LILYPATLLYLFMVFRSFWVEFFGSLRYMILLSANRDTLTISLPISFRVCLMKLGALTLDAYRLITVTSFYCISPFISMECPSLPRLINVSLKSILSKISIAIPAYFRGPLAW